MQKSLILYGTSSVSWKDAIVKTVEQASKTIDYINSITILEQKAKIDIDKITEYFVKLDLCFTIDENRN